MSKLSILFWWDVEDFINPQSDDALFLILQEFRKRDIPAVLKMVGRKMRVLLQRERRDVIDLMKDDLFEIGYHTDGHSIHPTIAEYTENCDWHSGVAEILQRESDGVDITRATFGKELVCYGQPGASYTPFIYGVLPSWGIPSYLGNSVYLGDSIMPTEINGIFNPSGMWSSRGSFDARAGDAALPAAKAHMESLLETLPVGGLVSHGNHPNEWSLEQWWDEVNFLAGASPSPLEYKPARLVPVSEMIHRVALFAEYLDWISGVGLHAVSLREMLSLFDSGRMCLTRGDVRAVARRWTRNGADLFVDLANRLSLSAAQCLYVMSRFVVSPSVKRIPVMPVDAPVYLEGIETGQIVNLNSASIKELARLVVAHVERSGILPARIQAPGGGSVTPSAFGAAVARDIAGVKDHAQAAPTEFRPAAIVRAYGTDIGPWSIHDKAFTGDNLRRYTQLLSWSYRPLFRRR